MNWASYRDNVLRPLLKDSLASNYNWSDAELLQYTNWGLEDLSSIFPAVASYTLTGAGPTYDLPSDFHALDSVLLAENEQTTVVPSFDLFAKPYLDFVTPDAYSEPGYLLDYPAEGTLYVSPYRASGSYVLRYFKIYSDIVLTTDIMPFTRRRWLSQALAYYVGYCAHIREGVGRAALEQWSQRPDLLVKNPLNAEAAEFNRAYRQIVADQKERG